MKYYSVVLIDFDDRGWVPDYVAAVTPMIERHGGRYLARTSRVERVEGEMAPPQMMVLVEWPSQDAAQGFYTSAEYQPFLEARRRGSQGRFFMVAGEDVARPAVQP